MTVREWGRRWMAFVTVVSAACVGEGNGAGEPPALGGGTVEVSRAVVAEPVLGERTALYFHLINSGARPDTLLGVDAGTLGSATLHLASSEDGVSRMRPVEAVEIPASGRLELRPGGLHVMLEDLQRPLYEGETVPLTVRLARGGAIAVRAAVVAYADLQEALEF